mmetsp:Transcript_31882/g.95980  ORF Transcript_31882/g.95980 Transcript_31882/m.95980 type:complete len:192 (-) Transcript_31882:85-660(-)|eukprot:CAMPEP_0182917120 /NCGR_PEP_ID=MMETSP0105_2-20130417/1338_1 /TAXON_ID=81532 ORGANISM="Acanthoeca-like sp., Strain 10tr" /NCGR_SAMPLE_ID=MMETSP0105_2 /ASSEMBLY_ACC=CAM_ASM_000205 /LENGTH=191 /DNA_ID=CAMNT_0025054109 /DNA_START=318 /DNA_END=893 /DNA_ORIENTATION=+
MYGDVAIELLRELKRSAPHTIPLYNEDRVRQAVEEINSLFAEVRGTLKEFEPQKNAPPVAGSMMIQYEAILRNKRCVLAYLMERVKRLQMLRWDVGAVLPHELKESLSLQETDFFLQYSRGLNAYTSNVGIDLTTDLIPPKDLYIEVRCLENIGEIMTEEGTMLLEKGSQHFLRRSDVEPLIRAGKLEHIV